MPKLKPKDPLAAIRKDPSKVKSVELNPANARNKGFDVQPLTTFPEELLACKNLERLEIFRGIDGADVKIPEAIGRLAALKELTLGGLSIEALPEAIGKLKNLTSLSLAYNEQLATLPTSIGQLTALQHLGLSYTALKTLPESIGKLKSLKTLQLHEITDVPKELFDLTGIEELDLGGTTKLVPGLGKLVNLKALTIHSEALASSGAEVARLPRLQSLFIRGGTATPPAEIFAIPTLLSLRVRGVGLTSVPPLDRLVLLERLDISDNKLTRLAAAIAVLPKLKELAFSGNPLPSEEKRALDAMMKLRPKDRAAKVPASAASTKVGKVSAPPAPEKAVAPTITTARSTPTQKKAAAADAPVRLGDIVGANASLDILIAEGTVAAKYKGTKSGDWEHAKASLARADAAVVTIGKGTGLVLSLEVGQGKASTWWLEDGSLVLVEAVFEKDEAALNDDDRALFYEFIRAPLTRGTKPSGRLRLKHESDWSLVLAPITEDCSGIGKLLRTISSTRARVCGAESSGLLVDVVSTDWKLFLEPPVKAAWGAGRRAVFVAN